MKTFIHSIIVFCLLLLTPLALHASNRGPTGNVRIGIFPFMPLNYIDSAGVAQGLNADLLREMVKDQRWKVEFVPGSWAECLERLQNQEIDLMVSVAYSPERSRIMDYSYESVAELWGQVFLRPEDHSKNINDLDGRRVGVMRKDISAANFIKTSEELGVHCEIVEFTTHDEVFQAVQQKVVEAGVAPQHFGLRHLQEYNLVGSSILFSPFSIYFASKKGTQHELLSHIDAQLSAWKKDKDSYYYDRLSYWLGNSGSVTLVPGWLLYAFFTACVVICLFAGFVLVLRETVRYRTNKLAESEAMLLEAQEIACMGRWDLDLTNGRLAWSDSIYAMFEISRASHTPSYETLFDFIHPDDRAPVDRAFRESVENKTPYKIEHRLLMPDGRVKWVSEIGRTEYSSEGDPVRSIGTIQEITERKKAELALLESKARYHTLLHTAMDGFWVVDRRGRLLEVNETYCLMSGYSAEELLGMTFYEVEVNENTRDVIARAKKIIAQGEGRFEALHRRKDGGLFNVEISVQYRPGDDAVFVAFLRDITGIKKAEEEKRSLRRQLLQVQKMEAIGTLAGGIAHDFNNILAVILGNAELAREDAQKGSMVEHEINQILQAGNRAKDLVRQILDFSRQSESARTPLRPGIIIRETLKMLRASLPSTIVVEQEIDMNSGLILADQTQLHQLLMNLCTNAFHAMEKNGGTLSIGLRKIVLTREDLGENLEIQPGHFVQIAIRDTGVGIPLEIQERIYDPYFTTKEVGKGTGMGLAIVHGIVKSYGGMITCRSTVGTGTVFRVNLPVIEATAQHEVRSIDTIPMGTERILFVDDEQMLAEMGRTMLERLGYAVTMATSSSSALSTFTSRPYDFDLVVTDQTMPGMTGIDLCSSLRITRPDIPIILCTGYSSLISEETVKDSGIQGFATKPLARREFATLIRNVLDQRDAIVPGFLS